MKGFYHYFFQKNDSLRLVYHTTEVSVVVTEMCVKWDTLYSRITYLKSSTVIQNVQSGYYQRPSQKEMLMLASI